MTNYNKAQSVTARWISVCNANPLQVFIVVNNNSYAVTARTFADVRVSSVVTSAGIAAASLGATSAD